MATAITLASLWQVEGYPASTARTYIQKDTVNTPAPTHTAVEMTALSPPNYVTEATDLLFP